MKCYDLESEQFIDQPIEKVFDFFSRPENLEKITHPKYHFTILTPKPIFMEKGTLIDYTIRILGFSVHWRALISSYNPPHSFIDEQIKGPYLLWHHKHNFKEKNGGTIILDSIRYAVPMGIIGRFLNYFWIRNDIKRIFKHRRKFIFDLNYHDNKEAKV